MCQMATLKFQQLDGLNTRAAHRREKDQRFRTLTTESLAVFMPLRCRRSWIGRHLFGGKRHIHNLIMCNKENLLNQSAFLLGVPGSGKSFSAKETITFLYAEYR